MTWNFYYDDLAAQFCLAINGRDFITINAEAIDRFFKMIRGE